MGVKLDNITGVDTHVFYTFVGSLNIEFGFVGTIVIGLLLSFFYGRNATLQCTDTTLSS